MCHSDFNGKLVTRVCTIMIELYHVSCVGSARSAANKTLEREVIDLIPTPMSKTLQEAMTEKKVYWDVRSQIIELIRIKRDNAT